jgi:hypothetical protein
LEAKARSDCSIRAIARAALLEFVDEWDGGNNGEYYEYSLLLRSLVLA